MDKTQKIHDMAIGFATALSINEIRESKEKDRLYDPNEGVANFAEAYDHALEFYSSSYKD
ncbi:hypothetical protein WOSG25_140030 [Weissella oryzae SG25]|uniref:Uncharacterized protein n=1 Tax=Weissella oryzae (strain DSM 25784 / JCM 18191 / LMG 30913 / SG25) TaxID=1329250 RepID=A0A069D2Q8_WEIOS|nr:hypothetical protein [Weissella oryzae]GAK31701.1 hypothetical protein WOSG25_140030 [Weissella oryzae SG25]